MIGKVIDSIVHRLSSYKSVYYSRLLRVNGCKILISGECKISCPENIHIGVDTMVNGGTMIYASPNASITIGAHCIISYNVCLRTLTHHYERIDIPIKHQPHIEKNITIADDVWIGYGAIVMPGVTIGKGCIIGAGAVVTKDCEDYGVYVGVPAKKIRDRKNL